MNEDIIDSFTDNYFFLSNFSLSEVTYEGMIYPTVEHAFQAAKTLDIVERCKIAALSTPGQAKRAGRKVLLRDDWENIKIEVMRNLLHQKFEQPDLKKKLEETFPKDLIEGNNWGDTFWGVCDGEGRNVLGKLLMGIRNRHNFIRRLKQVG